MGAPRPLRPRRDRRLDQRPTPPCERPTRSPPARRAATITPAPPASAGRAFRCFAATNAARSIAIGVKRLSHPSHSSPNHHGIEGLLADRGGQTDRPVTWVFEQVTTALGKRPRRDSNARTRLRRPMLYPLSYGGREGTSVVRQQFTPGGAS